MGTRVQARAYVWAKGFMKCVCVCVCVCVFVCLTDWRRVVFAGCAQDCRPRGKYRQVCIYAPVCPRARAPSSALSCMCVLGACVGADVRVWALGCRPCSSPRTCWSWVSPPPFSRFLHLTYQPPPPPHPCQHLSPSLPRSLLMSIYLSLALSRSLSHSL